MSIWRAWTALDSSRQFGMAGPQPILISEVLAYGTLYHYSLSELDRLLRFIQYLDDLKFRHLANKRPPEGEDTTS